MADTDIDTGAPATTGVETEVDVDTTLLNDDGKPDEGEGEPDTGGKDTHDSGEPDDGKPDESGADESGKDTGPETYADFTLPEGVELNSELLTTASAMFKADGLSQEQAQKYVDFFAGNIQAGAQAQTETYNQLMDDWRTQAQSDKDFGGDDFAENIGIAQNAIDKFGTPELKEFLEAHGAGNHPEMIRFMVKVGRLTKEDNPGNNGQAHSKGKQDHAELLYPSN